MYGPTTDYGPIQCGTGKNANTTVPSEHCPFLLCSMVSQIAEANTVPVVSLALGRKPG